MLRRNLIRSTVTAITVAAGASLLSSCQIRKEDKSSSSAIKTVKWKMATSWPFSLDTIMGGAETISQRVNELSGGKFQIKTYAAGEIVPGLEVLDAVQSGSVECGHTASYYYKGKNPSFSFGTSLPFGLSAQQQNAWLYEGGGNAEINKIFSDFGVLAFPAGNTGAQMGGWFKKELGDLETLKGLKMRIPGLGGEVMASLGVNVQVLPAGEVYLALDRGAIDAAEWTGPYDDEKLGFNKAANFYMYPGWWEPGPTLHGLVNKNAWKKLPAEYKAIFSTACYEANLTMLSKYDVLNSAALKRMLDKGTKLIKFQDQVLKAAEEKSNEIYSDISNKDISFRKLLNTWQEFRNDISKWNKINEFSLSEYRYK
tara:strand:+ start:14925 stop:16031 length:1107 start_codon:yes stop_codon:yes gene_type:complete